MKELKTLNDLPKFHVVNIIPGKIPGINKPQEPHTLEVKVAPFSVGEPCPTPRILIDYEQQKQVTIKRIKALHMPFVKVENNQLNSDVWDSTTKRLIRNSQASILMDFFNITEEDLKDV
jgi:hypothetical protein